LRRRFINALRSRIFLLCRFFAASFSFFLLSYGEASHLSSHVIL
jgi:hypothetical protein